MSKSRSGPFHSSTGTRTVTPTVFTLSATVTSTVTATSNSAADVTFHSHAKTRITHERFEENDVACYSSRRSSTSTPLHAIPVLLQKQGLVATLVKMSNQIVSTICRLLTWFGTNTAKVWLRVFQGIYIYIYIEIGLSRHEECFSYPATSAYTDTSLSPQIIRQHPGWSTLEQSRIWIQYAPDNLDTVIAKCLEAILNTHTSP